MIWGRSETSLQAVKWIVLVALLVAPAAFAQTPSKQFDPYKKSSLGSKVFDTKTFTSKNFQTKEVESKQFETKEFPAQTSSMMGERFASKNFAPPEKKVSWWQKLFGTRDAGMSGKTAASKNYATTNFASKAMPTTVDEKLQEKVDHMRSPKSLAMPNIRPTPEEINKPVGAQPKSFPTATPAPR